MPHNFHKKHFSKPTWCAFCEKFIWGLGKQGYGCKICYYPCHPKCLDLITEPCPGKKVKWGKKAIDNAKSKTVASPKDTVRKRGASRSDKEKEVDIIPSVDSDSEEEVVTTPKEKKMPNKLVSQPSLARISKGEIVEVAEKIEDVYDIGKELGSGAFSIVKSCRHKKTGEEFAVKIIRKENVKQDLHRLAIEMQVLESVKHPNIIELKEVFETNEMLYIVTEIVTGENYLIELLVKVHTQKKMQLILLRNFLKHWIIFMIKILFIVI